MLTLQWNRNNYVPGLVLEWRGPNLVNQEWLSRNAIININDITSKIAVISGPRGQQGDPGVTTIVYQGVEPDLLDGGNF